MNAARWISRCTQLGRFTPVRNQSGISRKPRPAEEPFGRYKARSEGCLPGLSRNGSGIGIRNNFGLSAGSACRVAWAITRSPKRLCLIRAISRGLPSHDTLSRDGRTKEPDANQVPPTTSSMKAAVA